MPKKKTIAKKIKARAVIKEDKVKKPIKTRKKLSGATKTITEKAPEALPSFSSTRYYEAVGRRKTAVARVRIWTRGEKELIVNDKPYSVYFPTPEMRQTADAALRKMKCQDKFRVMAKVSGGGLVAQSEAVRHGIARALVVFNADFKKRLRRVGYMTRDPRMRERKKFGLKRARRAPQWAKR